MSDLGYYSGNKLLSYNEYLNFILGGRGIGKTFTYKKHLLKKYLKKEEQFIYLRRNKTELDRIDKDKFFNKELLRQVFKNFDLVNMVTTRVCTKIFFKTSDDVPGQDEELPTSEREHELIIYSTKIILNKRVVAYLKSLSTWVDLKGSEYDEVTSILFDEVLIDLTSSKRYLNNEVEALFNMIYSVFRNRLGCHVYLLSNSSNFNNPYFNYFGFEGDKDNRFWHLKSMRSLIEFPPEKATDLQGADQNPFLQLIRKSDIYDTLVNNEFQEKAVNNVIKFGGEKRRLYSVFCDSTYLTLYAVDNKIYVSKGYDKNLKCYTFNIKDIESGFTYLNRGDPLCKHIRKHFYNNLLYYSDIDTKFKFTQAIRKII